jgi:glycosyltransferase involved in cell wall biosynthesis
MKIVVTGTRGIPKIQGGVETHCEELYPRIVRIGINVTLVRRSCYISIKDDLKEYNGVKLKTIFAPHIKSIEALVHTFLSILWAKIHKADIVHIHAIGPALLSPFARLLGLRVIFTHHGFDYQRAKWGPIAMSVLKLGEKLGTRYANEVIVISEIIRTFLFEKHARGDTHLIFNGVPKPTFTLNIELITGIGLEPRKFILALGRFVEEKGFDLLINAYRRIKQKDYRLVIAGDSDHETDYSKHLKDLAKANNVVLTGFIKGEMLHELLSHARLFVLPSSHEGLSISLLEAMSYKLPCLASDILANKQIKLPENRYFITGNENSLVDKLDELLKDNFNYINYDMAPYDWDHIAELTKKVYMQAMYKKNFNKDSSQDQINTPLP